MQEDALFCAGGTVMPMQSIEHIGVGALRPYKQEATARWISGGKPIAILS